MNTDSLSKRKQFRNGERRAPAPPRKILEPRFVLNIKTGNIAAVGKGDDAQNVRGRVPNNSLKPLEALYLLLFMNTFQNNTVLISIRLKLFSGYPRPAGLSAHGVK